MAQAGCLKHLCCSFLSMCHNSVSNVAFRFLLQKSLLEEPRLLQSCLLNRLCSTSSKGEDSASKQVPELSDPDSPDRAAEPVKQNTERTKQRKLHNRVLSKEVKGELRSFRKSLSSFPEADLFGILGKGNENSVCEEKTKLNIDKTECGKVRREASSNMDKHLESQNRILTGEKDAENQIEKRQQHLSLRRHAAFKIHGNRRNKAESWTDTFGTLQEDNLEDRITESLLSDLGTHEERLSDYEDDKKRDRSHIRLSATHRRHIPMWYGRKIAKLAKRGRIREAIQLFEEQMLQEDRVKPDAYVFTSLIAGLGHAGYTAKAFKLFNKMKKMAVEPIPHTYTALFNACANSPWKHDGLQRAEHLHQLMQEKEIEPTLITGKAMIKAFGICGDLRQAFSIMDQLSQSFRLDQEAFSSLLMACVSDKQAGLRFAIQVWRLMKQMGVRPDLPLYNLLLRCVRDCGAGEVATVEDLLGKTTHSAKSKEQKRVISAKDNKEVLLLPPMMRSSEEGGGGCDPHHTVSSTVSAKHTHQDLDSQAGFENRISLLDCDSTDLCTDASQRRLLDETTEQLPGFCHGASVLPRKDMSHAACSVSIPDLLSPTSSTTGVAALGDLSSRESRLALLGGTEGILERMKADGVQPDIRTFSQLVTVAMPTLKAEKKLLMEMVRMKVKPDVDFFNMLMQKRIARRDLMAAREVRQLIEKHKLIANMRTYGILAMTCCSEEEGLELLKDMEEAEVQPNIEILGTLMRASQLKFGYKLKVLQVVQKLDLSPNPVFLQHIESSLAHARQRMVEVETKKEEESYLLSKGFQRNMERFEQHYEEWLNTVKVERPPHPWASFKPKQLADDDELVVSRG